MSTDTLQLELPVRSRPPTPAPSSGGDVSAQDTLVYIQATQPIDVPEYVPNPNIWGYLKPDGTQAYTFHLVAPGEVPTRAMYKKYDVRGGELGRGAFGAVIKALHMEEGKYYAIKMIQHDKVEPGTDLSDTMLREVAVMQRVGRHRHICHLKEFFAEEDELALVLELVYGGNLKGYMNKIRPRRMSEAQAQYLTYQICDALLYIHTQEVVHRDLKPENVLLTAHDPPVVKVADFGLARAVDGVALSQTKCGTPAYVAPEVCDQSGGGYDVLVDSWSLGVMVFQMLTMRLPFDDDARKGSSRVFDPIEPRPIRWDVLDACGIGSDGTSTLSPRPPIILLTRNFRPGQAFLRGLLAHDPRGRMTMAAARDHAWLSGVRNMWPAEVREDEDVSSAFREFLYVVPLDGEVVESMSGEDSEPPTKDPGDRADVASGNPQPSAPCFVGAIQLSTLTDLGGSWMRSQTQTQTKTRFRSPNDDFDDADTARAAKRPRTAVSGDRATLTMQRETSESAVESGYNSWAVAGDTGAQLDNGGHDDHGDLFGTVRDPVQGVDEGREDIEER
ncbi:hypothetical protein TRAPUB_3926 [Trametes pubescens]|uniref:Protein kinase domain-containing protein n=1 Tax=Trametes pubescens TaxID=154538 RepID=A0A1M2VCE0_TRAPU|nr:hypothetical protein TRAPUB_3926 [Trametes pubescens]